MKAKLSEDSDSRKWENKNVVEEIEGEIKSILENNHKRPRSKKHEMVWEPDMRPVGVTEQHPSQHFFGLVISDTSLHKSSSEVCFEVTLKTGWAHQNRRPSVEGLKLTFRWRKEGSKRENSSLENNIGFAVVRKPKATLPTPRAESECRKSMKIWIGDSLSPWLWLSLKMRGLKRESRWLSRSVMGISSCLRKLKQIDQIWFFGCYYLYWVVMLYFVVLCIVYFLTKIKRI